MSKIYSLDPPINTANATLIHAFYVGGFLLGVVAKTQSRRQSTKTSRLYNSPPPSILTHMPDIFKMFLRSLIILCAVTTCALSSFLKRQGFDATAQLIDVSGAHAFLAPGASDLRGPCPAMNALANHGYIARDGYTNFQEALDAITKVFGAGAYLPVTFCISQLEC